MFTHSIYHATSLIRPNTGLRRGQSWYSIPRSLLLLDSAGDRAVECVVVYSEDSPTALIVVGLGLLGGPLNYMALVDLLASDLMGPRLQEIMKLQVWAFAADLLGAGGMSLMAKWA